MLRIAEGFDRSHYQLVRGVNVRRRGEKIVLVADAKRQAQLEVWAGRRRASDLARLTGMTVGVSTPSVELTMPAARTTAAATTRSKRGGKPALRIQRRPAARRRSASPPPPQLRLEPR
jgi:hypothetical protein